MRDAATCIDRIQGALQEAARQRDLNAMRVHYGLLEAVTSAEPLSASAGGAA